MLSSLRTTMTRMPHAGHRWVHRVSSAPAPHLRRMKSTAAAPSARDEHDKLASGSSTLDATSSTGANNENKSQPSLVKVPSIPIFGSTLSLHSGTPSMNKNNFLQWWVSLHDQYGDFYQIGLPGIGSGHQGITHVITDPKEMMKVLKQEGTHPSGLVEAHWATKAYLQDRGFALAEMYSRGEGWKRHRSFMQKDLLAPQAAREHLPGLIQTAQTLSQQQLAQYQQSNVSSDEKSNDNKTKNMKDSIMEYLNLCSLDMFTTVLFGSHLSKSAKLAEEGIDYDKFRKSAVRAISESIKLKRDPLESFLYKGLGMMTARHKQFRADSDTVFDVGLELLQSFEKDLEAGKLDEQQMNAYVAKALARQEESDLSVQDVNEICTILLMASVDTTAGKLAWNLLQLGLNPSVQHRLFEEVDRWVQREGTLVPEMFTKANTPILQAIIRETHRMTPAVFINLIKEVQTASVEVNGVMLAPGSVVAFDSYNPGRNPTWVKHPNQFVPDRWFPEAVEARKGSSAEILDHPFFAGPFSQGARRCPGSRVAFLEVQVLLAQIVLDWKLEVAGDLRLDDIDSKLETTLVPIWPDIYFERRQ